MANDYHIYIHSENGTGQSNKTIPYQNVSIATGEEKQDSFGFKNFLGTAKSAAQSGLVETGIAALSKAVPWVAAVIAAVKIADHVVTTGFAHQQEYTGHFQNNCNYENFKTGVNSVLHPIKTSLSITHRQFQYNKQNLSIQQQNKLIGESILKDFNIGV